MIDQRASGWMDGTNERTDLCLLSLFHEDLVDVLADGLWLRGVRLPRAVQVLRNSVQLHKRTRACMRVLVRACACVRGREGASVRVVNHAGTSRVNNTKETNKV